MQCFIGISRNTQLKSNTCILLLTECVWESQSTALFINKPFFIKKVITLSMHTQEIWVQKIMYSSVSEELFLKAV